MDTLVAGKSPRIAVIGSRPSKNAKTDRGTRDGDERAKPAPPMASGPPPRHYAAKLQMLGAGAGRYLLFSVAAIGALAALGLFSEGRGNATVALPMVLALPGLALAWFMGEGRDDRSHLPWYVALVLSLLLASSGWAAALVEVLGWAEPLRQVSGELLVGAAVLAGALFLAVDLMVVTIGLLGFAAAGAFYFLSSGMIPAEEHLWLTIGFVFLVVPLTAWSSRHQGDLLRTLAERDAWRNKQQSGQLELDQLKERISAQIKHQKEVERELSLAKEAAESASFAKTEFLATMSHEIRTPLNGILPILEILRETQLDPEQREFVTTALNSSHHLVALINDILDYSKIEAGKLELETIDVNVPELIESVIALMSKAAERRGLRLNHTIAKNVPVQVRGDPFRLRQILTNLVGNAIKFTEKGTISVEVSRHASSPKEVVLLFAVRDTGIGMSQETVDHLFQLFSQADASMTRKYGGTGLGLVICQRLVELMGGRIGVRSEQGKGSLFWFVVPMRKALHEVPSARKSLQGVRTLVAGFDVLERQRLDAYLQEWDMLCEHAETAVEVLTKLKASAKLGTSWSYDLLILDAQSFAGEVGPIVKGIRKVFELSGLIILTVDAFPTVAPVLKDAGLVEVISRPVQQEELRARLYRVLDVESYRKAEERSEGERLLMPDAAYSWQDRQARQDLGPEPVEVVPPPATVPADNTPLAGTVLVVEDNPVNLTVVKTLLQRIGVTPDTARDGVEAVDAVKSAQYDLVLMDVQMPNMDGYEATRRIRIREKELGLAHLPIVAMTANAMAGDREKCLASGMDDYMAKPIKPADVKAMLRQWLPMEEVISELRSAAESANAAPPVESRNQAPKAVPAKGPGGAKESRSVLDRRVLEELFDIMEAESPALLREFLGHAPLLIAGIGKAAQSGDAAAMVLPAHSLKSSSANVGAMEVSGLAKRLEFMGREKNMGEAVTCWREMERAFADAGRALEEIIQRGHL